MILPAVLTLAAALAQAAPLPAASSPSPQDPVAPVIVQAPGPQAPDPAIDHDAHSFARAHGAATKAAGKLARWVDPVCLKTIGATSGQKALIAERLAAAARDAGVVVAAEGCHANVEVVLTDKPQPLMDLVAGHRDELLGYHYNAQVGALKAMTRPIQAWYATATQDRFGRVTLDDTRYPTGTSQACDGAMSNCISSVFANVLVVVDNHRLSGKPPAAVADYVALLALSQPRSLDGCEALPSILDLYGKACGHGPASQGLTEADAAYLKALYRIDGEQRVWLQDAHIADQMTNPGPTRR